MAPIIPRDGGTIADPAKQGTARCKCCRMRFTWGHPPKSSASWHLYETTGAPHCRWVACSEHAATARPSLGAASTLCPHAYATREDYFVANPPKGKRTFRGRATITVTPPPPVTPQTPAPWPPAAGGRPRKQRTQRAPVGAPAPTPISAAPASDETGIGDPIMDDDSPLGSLVSEDSGVLPDGTGYMPQDGEVTAIERAIRLGQNVLVLGPPGCGKTQLIRHIIARLGRMLVTILGADGTPRDEIIGRRDLVAGGNGTDTVWRDGLIPAAMRAGHVLYIDEINALPSGIRSAAYSALDSRREITLAENANEVLHAAPSFVCLASMNAEGFAGTVPLAPPLLQRMGCIIRLDYLPADREASLILTRVPGLGKRDAKLLVDVAGKLREAKTVGKKLNRMAAVGTRTLLDAAARIADGEDIRTACRLTIGGLTMDPVELKVITDTVDAVCPEAGAR